MNYTAYALCFFAGTSVTHGANIHEQYQDIVVNNEVVSAGVRECASRYKAIVPLLDKYKRRFTVLDIGASQGYFSFKIAENYNASVVMIEGNYSPEWHVAEDLYTICNKNTHLDNVIFLHKHLSVKNLENLAECEHFDVVLCLNVVHHFGDDWKRAADAIFKLGDHVIVESPPVTDKVFANNKNIHGLEEYLTEHNGQIIAQTPRHTDTSALSLMRLFNTPKTYIKRKQWYYGTNAHDSGVEYRIESNFENKVFIKHNDKEEIVRPWHAGINFMTFKALNGVWPNNNILIDKLIDYVDIQHGDLMPWNLILDGSQFHPIDDEDLTFDRSYALLLTLKFAQLFEEKELHNYVLNKLYVNSAKKNNSNTIAAPISYVPISYGELVDKITILKIKMEKTNDTKKLKNIQIELDALMNVFNREITDTTNIKDVIIELTKVNSELWDVEDLLRKKELSQEFDKEFIKLARSVYFTNDKRSILKRIINARLGSLIIEEKIYVEYAQ